MHYNTDSITVLYIVKCHVKIYKAIILYSETSDSGPSEKGTLYYKPLYRGQFMGPENSVSL